MDHLLSSTNPPQSETPKHPMAMEECERLRQEVAASPSRREGEDAFQDFAVHHGLPVDDAQRESLLDEITDLIAEKP